MDTAKDEVNIKSASAESRAGLSLPLGSAGARLQIALDSTVFIENFPGEFRVYKPSDQLTVSAN